MTRQPSPQAKGNTSAKGRKARSASPWNRGPMCDTPNAGRSFRQYQQRGAIGRKPSHNLLADGFEEVAGFVARQIRAGRVGYAVHVNDTGMVWLTKSNRQRVNELPESWKVGEYPYLGLRVEFIEEDLLDRQRALVAREAA